MFPVRLYLNPEIHEVMAITLGNHVLCGARVWRVYGIPNGDIRVQTLAWEQRNGCINNAGYAVLGQTAMKFIWKTYLENIAKSATSQGGSFHTACKHGRHTRQPSEPTLPTSRSLPPYTSTSQSDLPTGHQGQITLITKERRPPFGRYTTNAKKRWRRTE